MLGVITPSSGHDISVTWWLPLNKNPGSPALPNLQLRCQRAGGRCCSALICSFHDAWCGLRTAISRRWLRPGRFFASERASWQQRPGHFERVLRGSPAISVLRNWHARLLHDLIARQPGVPDVNHRQTINDNILTISCSCRGLQQIYQRTHFGAQKFNHGRSRNCSWLATQSSLRGLFYPSPCPDLGNCKLGVSHAEGPLSPAWIMI